MTKKEGNPRLSVQLVNGSKGTSPRLAGLYTEFTLGHSDVVQLDLRNQETLSQALPTLLKRAYEEADRALADRDKKK